MDRDFIPKLKKTRRENREKRKVRLEENNRRVQTHLIVATLIATVTFAAGFTMPGGYDGNQGPQQGMPVLLYCVWLGNLRRDLKREKEKVCETR
ncbi:hypothetical protein ACSBR2_039263 [Camellia fascicularis]